MVNIVTTNLILVLLVSLLLFVPLSVPSPVLYVSFFSVSCLLSEQGAALRGDAGMGQISLQSSESHGLMFGICKNNNQFGQRLVTFGSPLLPIPPTKSM